MYTTGQGNCSLVHTIKILMKAEFLSKKGIRMVISDTKQLITLPKTAERGFKAVLYTKTDKK